MPRRTNHRWAAALTVGAAMAVLGVLATPGQAGGIAAKGWQPPVLVSAREAHRETSLALSPKNPNLMAICDPSGVPNTANGQSYFHRSANGGRSWSSMKVETSQTDTRNYAFEGGDCDVAFDQGGTMYSADTWLGDLSVGHSSDGGKTWEGTAIAVSSPVVDRPWLVGGRQDTVYLSYQGLQCCTPSTIWFTKSIDGGRSFLPALPVTTANADGGYTWEGNFVVSPSGSDVYLVHSRRASPGLTNVDAGIGGETIWVSASHDGGTTWTPHLIATLPRRTASIYPSIALDAGGYLHVVWSQPRDDDVPIWYAVSKDKGLTWSSARALTSGATGYAPWIAGGKRGEVAITWLGTPKLKEENSQWFFYWARVTGSKVKVGRTTTRPLYVGDQIAPEFEMIRLDSKGRIHLGMSVYREDDNGRTAWAVYYQRETGH